MTVFLSREYEAQFLQLKSFISPVSTPAAPFPTSDPATSRPNRAASGPAVLSRLQR